MSTNPLQTIRMVLQTIRMVKVINSAWGIFWVLGWVTVTQVLGGVDPRIKPQVSDPPPPGCLRNRSGSPLGADQP